MIFLFDYVRVDSKSSNTALFTFTSAVLMFMWYITLNSIDTREALKETLFEFLRIIIWLFLFMLSFIYLINMALLNNNVSYVIAILSLLGLFSGFYKAVDVVFNFFNLMRDLFSKIKNLLSIDPNDKKRFCI